MNTTSHYNIEHHIVKMLYCFFSGSEEALMEAKTDERPEGEIGECALVGPHHGCSAPHSAAAALVKDLAYEGAAARREPDE